MASKLEEARKIINEVDSQIAELFVKRMHAAELVYEHKKEFGLPILDQAREDAVIEKNTALIEEDHLKGYYIDFIKNMMAVSRAYQYQMQNGLKVAYSGVEGAFAHIAAGKIFPGGNRISCPDFKAAYDTVVAGECDVAVLPIENSYAGEVGQNIDQIFAGNLYINGIYELKVRQNLLGVPGATIGDIKKVISHPQALSQCQDYIKSHGLSAEESTNTALAAKSVAEEQNKNIGAIASEETAEIYGLEVLERDINTSDVNTTRFAVLSRIPANSPALPNTILMFTVKNKAGALAKAISIIGEYGYNMTTLRSRPLKDHKWEYYFHIEIDGAGDNAKKNQMLEELEKFCDKLKVVGSFAPHAEI